MATEPVPTPATDAVDPAAKIAEFEAQLRTVAETSSNGLNAIRESLGRLEANPRLAQPVAPPTPTEEPDFFTDPRKATLQTVAPALETLARNQLQVNTYLARQAVERDPKLGRVLSKWGAEVDAIMAKEPIQAQANHVVWMNAAKTVLADHMDEITQAASKGQSYFVEPATSGGSASSASTTQVKRSLSEKESKVAKLFGMNDEDYLKRQEEVLAGVQD